MYNDIITEPGKFEGQPQWVEYYYMAVLDGSQDDTIDLDGIMYDVFKLHPSDLYYTELSSDGYDYVVIWTDDQGFTFGIGLSEKDYDFWYSESTLPQF